MELLSLERTFDEVEEIYFYFDKEIEDDDIDENDFNLTALDDYKTVLD